MDNDVDRVANVQEPEDLHAKMLQRRVQVWLFVCAVARVGVSSAVLGIGESTVDLKAFDHGNLL